MNKDWSEKNKTLQSELRKRDTFDQGIRTLIDLRSDLMDAVDSWKLHLSAEDYCAIPFINAKGYHSKTVAYSLWHIFRIEDTVAHTLIKGDEQVFFAGDYKDRIASPIITTGNELVKDQISAFSKQLDIDELYSYIHEVKDSTEDLLRELSFDDLKTKVTDERRAALESLGVVSTDEDAIWLIDYWCGKDIRGLIQMPFSRHWIMHIEACIRILGKLKVPGLDDGGEKKMELIKGSDWKACFEKKRDLYTAKTSVPGAIKLFEIDKEVFEELKSDVSDEDKYRLIHDKGRMLYMDIDDRCGPPYTVVLDDDYKDLCPWADLPDSTFVWSEELTDAAVEIFPSQEKNREKRRKKREERNKKKDR